MQLHSAINDGSRRSMAIHGLPVRRMDAVYRYANVLRTTEYLSMEGKQGSGWRVFTGRSLQEAQDRAWRAMISWSIADSVLTLRPQRVNAEIAGAELAFMRAAAHNGMSAALHAASMLALDEVYPQISLAVRRATGRAERTVGRRSITDTVAKVAAAKAESLAVMGLSFEGKPQHVRNVDTAWKVIEAGYCLAGMVDGVVFAYRAAT